MARTVAFNLAVDALDDPAQVGPPGQVLEVEADGVRLGEGVEIGRGDAQQVGRAHGADGRHDYARRRHRRRHVAVLLRGFWASPGLSLSVLGGGADPPLTHQTYHPPPISDRYSNNCILIAGLPAPAAPHLSRSSLRAMLLTGRWLHYGAPWLLVLRAY